MKRALFALVALLMLAAVSASAQVAAVPPLMNFQGRLAKPDGTPVGDGVYPIRFSLWDNAATPPGVEKWNQTISNVSVRNGAFAVLLSGFPAGLFNGSLFLEIKVGSDSPLKPRQPLVSVAYAMKAGSVADGSIKDSSIAAGTLTTDRFASGAFNPFAWLVNGNSGVTNGFLGTTDNNPLVFKVNSHTAMRYVYAENTQNQGFEYRSVNTIGGSEINSIAAGVVGGTISGGGQDSFTGSDSPNTVTSDFGTVAGGSLNAADGFSFVGGGYNNKATEFYSTIVGGTFNVASNNQTFIGGGIGNTASGFGAVVPGGQANEAAGIVSFAAGNNAHALHDGAFVWADNSQINTPVNSTAANQFLVHAAGGIELQGVTNIHGTTGVDYALTVDKAGIGAGAVSNGLRFGLFSGEGLASNRTSGSNYLGLDLITSFFPRVSITNGGFVGVGTQSPQGTLHVKGNQGLFNLEGTDHAYMQFFPRGFATGRKAYFGFPSAGSHDLEIANEDTGVVRIRGTFVNSSDARYKTNIAPLDNALDNVLNLRGVSYDWRRDVPGVPATAQRQVGFIAQEVEKIFPDLVYTDEKGYKSVNYIGVVPVLVEAVKTLNAKVDEKQKQIDELKKQNERIAALEKQLAALLAAQQRDAKK